MHSGVPVTGSGMIKEFMPNVPAITSSVLTSAGVPGATIWPSRIAYERGSSVTEPLPCGYEHGESAPVTAVPVRR